jgi:predicted transcriptional regulator
LCHFSTGTKKPGCNPVLSTNTTKEIDMQRIINQPLARSNDPVTSFEAAESARAFIPTHENIILEVLGHAGPSGVDKIAGYAGLEPHAVGKRMKKLEGLGLACLTGKDVDSDSGRKQREWRIA